MGETFFIRICLKKVMSHLGQLLIPVDFFSSERGGGFVPTPLLEWLDPQLSSNETPPPFHKLKESYMG